MSFYNFTTAYGQGNKRYVNFKSELSITLDYLNNIERHFSLNSTVWDPNMEDSPFVHVHVLMNGSQKAYLRDAIDHMRSVAGVPPFPWQHTTIPTSEEWNYRHDKGGVCLNDILFYRQAIGRLRGIGRLPRVSGYSASNGGPWSLVEPPAYDDQLHSSKSIYYARNKMRYSMVLYYSRTSDSAPLELLSEGDGLDDSPETSSVSYMLVADLSGTGYSDTLNLENLEASGVGRWNTLDLSASDNLIGNSYRSDLFDGAQTIFSRGMGKTNWRSSGSAAEPIVERKNIDKIRNVANTPLAALVVYTDVHPANPAWSGSFAYIHVDAPTVSTEFVDGILGELRAFRDAVKPRVKALPGLVEAFAQPWWTGEDDDHGTVTASGQSAGGVTNTRAHTYISNSAGTRISAGGVSRWLYWLQPYAPPGWTDLLIPH